jgi:hypothetical protein
MDENTDQEEEHEDGNRMSHENAEEHGENTVPREESPLPSKKPSGK